MCSQKQIEQGICGKEEHEDCKTYHKCDRTGVSKHIEAVLINLALTVVHGNLQEVVRKKRSQEADVSECTNQDIGNKDDCVSDEEITSVVLRCLCIPQNRDSASMQVVSNI